MFRRRPTRPQTIMLLLLGAVVALLVAFGWVEMSGVMSSTGEDTFSEWVWDQSFPVVLAVGAVHLIVGVVAVGAVWHYLEGWARRRRIERRLERLGVDEPPFDP